ncbi:MAG TPA: cobalt transporter CbiM [Synechococcus sp. M44_DOE_062]|nr:cobalt transporter CbiM [Synechococcus sp. M44_DOE_062]
MHISDGILPAPLWLGGYGITALITGYSLRLLRHVGVTEQCPWWERDPRYIATQRCRDQLPKAALLTAVFFVASSIHLPFPPASLHLVLNGLMGLMLGALAYPAIVVGLFFQVVAFGHGGLTTLGINAAIMGIPALLAGGIFRAGRRVMGAGVSAFLAGAVGVGLAVLLFYGVVMAAVVDADSGVLSPEAGRLALGSLVVAHLPLMVVEGLFASWVVLFLQRVQPALLGDYGKR